MPEKFVADLEHVREVTVSGTADLHYWRKRLQEEGLTPSETDGAARILLTAADARFRGVHFRELSVCVFAGDGAFLVQAFNSVRFFAWVERVIFKTPYTFARVAIDAAAIRSEMVEAHCGPRKAGPTEVDGFDGPVYLPNGRWFRAHIAGLTERIAFDPARDTFQTTLAPLLESRFTPREWHLRRDARHAKGNTLPRRA
ncbi:MAG TPA: hypothetical protein VGF48_15985 [Thermoanaerobaculia bacterium]|jgi:hypothetical protein